MDLNLNFLFFLMNLKINYMMDFAVQGINIDYKIIIAALLISIIILGLQTNKQP